MSKEQMDGVHEESDQVTLDQVFAELDQILDQMEEENSLEETFRMYHRGIDLLKNCSDKIDKIEKQIRVLDEEGNTHVF